MSPEEENLINTSSTELGRKVAPRLKPWQISAEPAYLRSAHASPL